MAVPDKVTIYKKNSQYVKVAGLKDIETGVYFTSASVIATLINKSDGQPVAGFQNVTLTYVNGATPDGTYRGRVEKTFDPPKGSNYTLLIDSADAGADGHWEIPAEVKIRNK